MVKLNEYNHTYTSENGKQFLSVTQLLKIQGIAPSFEGVPEGVLRKAAERGTTIHAEFEQIINTKGECVVFSEEANWFLRNLYDPEDLWFSELTIWAEKLPFEYAGTIDIVRITRDGRILIYDIKTGKVHIDYVAWQLTLYSYGYAERNGLDVSKFELFCIDAKETGCKVVPIHPVREDEILRLLKAQAEGIPYISGDMTLSQSNLAKVEEFENALAKIDAEKKAIMDHYEAFQNQLMEAMQNNGVKTFETPKFKVTYVAPSNSMNFDSAQFKADHADLYEKYKTKLVSKKAYLKVTQK